MIKKFYGLGDRVFIRPIPGNEEAMLEILCTDYAGNNVTVYSSCTKEEWEAVRSEIDACFDKA